MPWAEYDYAEPLPPSPPAFHPEMGYLAPSRSTRRVLRVGLIAGGCGIALCAIAAVTRLPAQSSGAARADAASTMGRSSTTGWAENASTIVDAREPAVADRKRCSEQNWPYIDRDCSDNASGNPPPDRLLTPSPVAQADGSRVATQTATPAADGLKLDEEPQSPAASAPQREKTVRKKKISRSHQDDTRNAYASPFGGRSDYRMRSPQQRPADSRGWWSWW